MERSGGPAAVIRQSTIDLARILDKGKNGSSKDSRHVLGKTSFSLLGKGLMNSWPGRKWEKHVTTSNCRICQGERLGRLIHSKRYVPLSQDEIELIWQHPSGQNLKPNTPTTPLQNYSTNQLQPTPSSLHSSPQTLLLYHLSRPKLKSENINQIHQFLKFVKPPNRLNQQNTQRVYWRHWGRVNDLFQQLLMRFKLSFPLRG